MKKSLAIAGMGLLVSSCGAFDKKDDKKETKKDLSVTPAALEMPKEVITTSEMSCAVIEAFFSAYQTKYAEGVTFNNTGCEAYTEKVIFPGTRIEQKMECAEGATCFASGLTVTLDDTTDAFVALATVGATGIATTIIPNADTNPVTKMLPVASRETTWKGVDVKLLHPGLYNIVDTFSQLTVVTDENNEETDTETETEG